MWFYLGVLLSILLGYLSYTLIEKNKKLLDGAEDAVKTIEEQKTKILANPKSYSQEVKDAVKGSTEELSTNTTTDAGIGILQDPEGAV